MTKNMAIFFAFHVITGTLSGQHIDHVSMELLKWHIPYVLEAYVPVEVYGDGNCFVRAVSISCSSIQKFWALLKHLALFEVKDNAEYYTAGSNACKDYMGELAPFAPNRRLEICDGTLISPNDRMDERRNRMAGRPNGPSGNSPPSDFKGTILKSSQNSWRY